MSFGKVTSFTEIRIQFRNRSARLAPDEVGATCEPEYNGVVREVIFLSSPEVWQRGHGEGHPLKPERLKRTHELIDEVGALSAPNVRLVAPQPASREELALFHTEEYLNTVERLSHGERDARAGRFNFGPGDNPVFPGMYESERLKVGSALQGARLLMSGACEVAFSYCGGLHHGGPGVASGFCVFNDAAVAIRWLMEQGLRVAYVDIDVHHGDGVQAAFYGTDQVLTISIHQDGRTLFPGTGAIEETGVDAGRGYSLNVPLPPNTTDGPYLEAFAAIVPPMLARFEPDLLVTQLGVDTHILDPLANLSLTTHGQEQLFRSLSELAPRRWLALGGGGYNLSVVPRAWTLAFGAMSGIDLPEELPPVYRKAYGGRWLRDQEDLRRTAGMRAAPDAIVEEIIRRVRAVHSLS